MRIASSVELGTGKDLEVIAVGEMYMETVVVGIGVDSHEDGGVVAKIFYSNGGVRYSNTDHYKIHTNMVENLKEPLSANRFGNSVVVLDPVAKSFVALEWKEDAKGKVTVMRRPQRGEERANRDYLDVVKEVSK